MTGQPGTEQDAAQAIAQAAIAAGAYTAGRAAGDLLRELTADRDRLAAEVASLRAELERMSNALDVALSKLRTEDRAMVREALEARDE